MFIDTVRHPFSAGKTPPPSRPVSGLAPANRPFAQLPHDLAADPRLDAVDVRLVAALLYFAKADDSCWPSDRSLGERIGRKRASVQRHLRRLEAAGYVARDKAADNPTGRRIRLLWRETPPVSSEATPPVSPPGCDREKGEEQRTRAGAAGPPPAVRVGERPVAAAELPAFLAPWLDRPDGDPLRELALRQIARRR